MVPGNKYIVPVFANNEADTVKTLSTNGNFYFKFLTPEDLYWGLFCCKVSFYTIQNDLIYYNSDYFAQCGINPQKEWDFVFFSESGDLAFFIERNSTKTLFYVILDLLNRRIFKKEFTSDPENKVIITSFAKNDFSDELALEFSANQFEDINTDKPGYELKNIFGLTSWRPLL